MPLTDREAREHVARVDEVLERVEALHDANARETALAAIQALVDLYGEGLSRMVGYTAVKCAESGNSSLADAFVADELVSHLLLLHDLHPDSLEDRVRGALDEVRPYIHSHGGNMELVSVSDGVVQLKLEGSCKGCPASSLTLRTSVEDAIRAAAPEVIRIEADGVDVVTKAPESSAATGFIPLTRAHTGQTAWDTATPLASDAA